MYYVKTEEYSFKIPQEHKAYLKFKEELRDAGVRFTDEGGATHQSIKIRNHGVFKINDDGSFDLSKEK